nr:DUF3098 domain-containing protein [Saprospiraceae bacterium]
MTPKDSKSKKKIVPAHKKRDPSRKYQSRSKRQPPAPKEPMLFQRVNFKWMFIGIGFILLGLLLMYGGSMPSPDVWDESLIYSHRRITIAPMLMLIGFGLQIYAIFKK